MPSIREDPMTQLQVSDARDVAESVVTQAVEYAGSVTDEVKNLAGDVAQRVRTGLDERDLPGSKLPGRKRAERARKARKAAQRSKATRRLAWGLVFAAVAAVAVIAVRRSRSGADGADAQSPPVTNLGPEIGTDSDVPGPAYDPEAATP